MPTYKVPDRFEHFKTVEDPRVERIKDHALLDRLVIAVCAVIGGADDWVEIEAWGTEEWGWVRQFMALTTGLPFHSAVGTGVPTAECGGGSGRLFKVGAVGL